MLRPGEIYFTDAEGMEPHPVVIVSREELNRGDWVVAVLITSSHLESRSRLPNCVPFRSGQFGLTKDCVARAESISTIPVGDLDLAHGPLGVLDHESMRLLIRAVGNVMSALCEPD